MACSRGHERGTPNSGGEDREVRRGTCGTPNSVDAAPPAAEVKAEKDKGAHLAQPTKSMDVAPPTAVMKTREDATSKKGNTKFDLDDDDRHPGHQPKGRQRATNKASPDEDATHDGGHVRETDGHRGGSAGRNSV